MTYLHAATRLLSALYTTTVLQVDTPGKKLLVGVAVTYVLTVLLVPTANIFIQVGIHNILKPWLAL